MVKHQWLLSSLVLVLTAAVLSARAEEDGLSNKQLRILNYFLKIAAAPQGTEKRNAAEAAADFAKYGWDGWSPGTSGQLGIDGHRYQLAFPAYAIAATANKFTPAYTTLASEILQNLFARMLAPRVWHYWDTPGRCAGFLGKICSALNVSYCDLSFLGQEGHQAIAKQIEQRLDQLNKRNSVGLVHSTTESRLNSILGDWVSPGAGAFGDGAEIQIDEARRGRQNKTKKNKKDGADDIYDGIFVSNTSFHASEASLHCPDPNHLDNIMYSGHLGMVGVLYELLSADTSLSTEGWYYEGSWHRERNSKKRFNYTLPKLLERFQDQQISNPHQGFSCEPGFIFNPCNIHTYAAQRLYDAMYGTKYSSETARWTEYVRETAVRRLQNPYWAESYFETIYLQFLPELALPGSTNVPWVDIAGVPGGSPANDGWVGTWLAAFVCPNSSLLSNSAKSLDENEAWASDGDGEKLLANDFYTQKRYTTAMATSMYLAAGSNITRKSKAEAYMDRAFGAPFDAESGKDGYYYPQEEKAMTQWVTASMLLGASVGQEQIYELFGIDSSVWQHRQTPVLQEVAPAAPKVLVRKAHFRSSQLEFVLTSPKAASADAVVSALGGIGDDMAWKVESVVVNDSSWQHWALDRRLQINRLDLLGNWADLSVRISFTQARASRRATGLESMDNAVCEAASGQLPKNLPWWLFLLISSFAIAFCCLLGCCFWQRCMKTAEFQPVSQAP